MSNTSTMGVPEGKEKMLHIQMTVIWKVSKSDKRPQHTNSRYSENFM